MVLENIEHHVYAYISEQIVYKPYCWAILFFEMCDTLFYVNFTRM